MVDANPFCAVVGWPGFEARRHCGVGQEEDLDAVLEWLRFRARVTRAGGDCAIDHMRCVGSDS